MSQLNVDILATALAGAAESWVENTYMNFKLKKSISHYK